MQRLVGIASLVALWLCACPAVQAADVNHYVSTQGGLRVLPPMYYEANRYAAAPVSYGHAQVSYNQGYAAGPTCGAEAQCCDHEPSCNDSLWDDYCCTKKRCHRHNCLAFLHRCKHRGGGCATDCGCDLSCGTACDTGCSTGCQGGCHNNHGCDSCHAYDTVGLGCDACCSGQRWGFRGCNAGCKTCYRPLEKPIRCWANSWCGDLVDGYASGHPVCAAAPAAPCTNCQLGSPAAEAPMNAPVPMPADSNVVPPMPGEAKEALPVPEKAARSFRYSPISTRNFQRVDVIK
jgi:hypothetical protein